MAVKGRAQHLIFKKKWNSKDRLYATQHTYHNISQASNPNLLNNFTFETTTLSQ